MSAKLEPRHLYAHHGLGPAQIQLLCWVEGRGDERDTRKRKSRILVSVLFPSLTLTLSSRQVGEYPRHTCLLAPGIGGAG